jgi:hypothetical protein
MSYAALSAFATALSAEYADDLPTAEDEAWEGSPFNWIRQEAPGTKGKIGRDLARSILEALGVTVGSAGTALTANGITIRSKLSLEWGAGAFKFQQIRDEPFEYVFCLGIYPEGAYGWLIPRSDLIVDGIWQERDGLTPQHGGIAGTDTYWLSVDPADPPAWLAGYGGPLPVFETVISTNL